MCTVETSFQARANKQASPVQLEILRQLIAEPYGFWINDAWAGQVNARLAERIAVTKRAGIDDYLLCLRTNQAELTILVESLLNGETHFLRTEPHFAALVSTVITTWRASRQPERRLRIASLGCSTGEEVYSIAMILHETLTPEELADVEITGVDINSRSLATARNGCYEEHQLRELSPLQRKRWFQPTRSGWQIHPDLHRSVRFLQHNLLTPLPFADLDVIFCRNVLIYFQRPIIACCIREFYAALRTGGYLFLGHSESALAYPQFFAPVHVRDGIIYQKKTSPTFLS